MTTYTLEGVRFSYDGSRATGAQVTQLTLVTTDDFTASYSALEPFDGFLSDVDLIADTGQLLVSEIDGAPIDGIFTPAIGLVEIQGGIMETLLFYNEVTDEDYVFRLGGFAPVFPTNAADAEVFTSTAQFPGPITSGPFQAGQSFTFDQIAGVQVTQDDIVVGSIFDDEFKLGVGQDTLDGDAGNDTLDGGAGNDLMDGGEGDDFLFAGAGNDTVEGGLGADQVFLNQGADRFKDPLESGVFGNDTVYGGGGSDTIEGGGDDDELYGQAGGDVIKGGQGNDIIFGGGGADTISGGAGDDTINSGNGRDEVKMGGGADLFRDNGQGGLNGQDTVFAGGGADTIEGGGGADVLYGQNGADVINGRQGADAIYGGGGADTIYGGNGNDVVRGGNGRDVIDLAAGADVFIDSAQTGPAGNDTITGGGGADRFVFASTIAVETITDFQVGIDTLELAAGLANGRSAAEIASSASIVSNGLLLDFGAGQTILLQGVSPNAPLDDSIDIL